MIDTFYDEELEQDVVPEIDYDQYISYEVGIWTLKNEEFYQEEVLSLHKCNQTDRSLFSKNEQYVNVDELNKYWESLYCLDNPEKIKMR